MSRIWSAGDDPGLPIESPALRAIFRDHDKIRTMVETTPWDVVVVQTSNDPATVATLQQHAAEVSDVVRDGMAAMHAAMMKNGGMMPGVHSVVQMGPMGGGHVGAAGHAGADSAFAALQERGRAGNDFSTSAFVHDQPVPGTEVMAAKRDSINPDHAAEAIQYRALDRTPTAP